MQEKTQNKNLILIVAIVVMIPLIVLVVWFVLSQNKNYGEDNDSNKNTNSNTNISKELSLFCTKEYSIDGIIQYESHYTFTFGNNGEVMTRATGTKTAEFSEDEIEKEYLDAVQMCDKYASVEELVCNVKKDGLKVTVVIDVDITNVEEHTKEDIGLPDGGYSRLKQLYEEDGYTCK